MVKMSTLSRKNQIAKKMQGQSPEVVQLQQQLEEAQKAIQKLELETYKAKESAADRKLEAAKKAAEIAQMIMANPAMGSVIDQILADNEYKDDLEGMEEEAPEEAPMPPEGQQNPVLGNSF
jgi:chromosome segregation ATPase